MRTSICLPVLLPETFSSPIKNNYRKENNMENKYTSPELEIIRFEAEDVIGASDPLINEETDTKIL